MKEILLIIITFVMLSVLACQQEQLSPSITYDKTNIANDTNWVEVTDIDTLNLCFGPSYWGLKDLINHNILIKNENEYKTLFYDAVATTGKDFHLTKCDTIYKSTGVDYTSKFLIIYSVATGDDKFVRKIYRNKNTKEYLYLVYITNISNNLVLKGFSESISLPIINSDIKILYDTIHTNF